MIQILGARGMLGSAICRAAQKAGIEHIPDERDICTVPIAGDVVINCAGIVKQRQEPTSQFMLVNAYAPHRLAEECEKSGARLIHVSTDCVFSGVGPHWESDNPVIAPQDVYAFSKLAGEVIRAPHLTVRTSFIGQGERGLIADLRAGKTVAASDELLWSGHTVDTISNILILLASRPDVQGLLHIPGEFQTRFGLVQKIARAIKVNAVIIKDNSFVADRRLGSSRWQDLGLPDLPPFEGQLKEMFFA